MGPIHRFPSSTRKARREAEAGVEGEEGGGGAEEEEKVEDPVSSWPLLLHRRGGFVEPLPYTYTPVTLLPSSSPLPLPDTPSRTLEKATSYSCLVMPSPAAPLNLIFPLFLLLREGRGQLCPCVLFNVTGRFHSADYPRGLTPTKCVMYHFQAPPDQFVRLTFEFFSLPQRDNKCTSYIRTYERSEDGIVDSSTEVDEEICGKEIQVGKRFHSLDRHFLLLVHTESVSKGFAGTHEFVKKSDYRNDAIEVSTCGYRVNGIVGKIFSPRFPYFYPPVCNCSWHFPPRKKSRVILRTHDLQLHSGAQLELTPIDENGRSGERISFITQQVHVADGFLLHFRSDEKFPIRIGYAYEEGSSIGMVLPDPDLLPFPSVANPMLDLSLEEDCNVRITPAKGAEGELASDDLVKMHPAATQLPFKCQISFVGQPVHKVSLTFTQFNLFHYDNPNNTKKCVEMDHLTADVLVGERLSRIDAWCGAAGPPPLMSSSNVLSLQYHTKSSQARRDNFPHEHFGFKLKYRFHSDWGNMPATWDPARGCRFVFNGSRQTSGKLWSVNHPGLYPRNIRCEYIFHGTEHQIVHVHFEYFDVEGFSACEEETHSDYVIFSNYQTRDRTNRRFCGKEAPKGPILSESNYFRMIFATNDIFDATGFFAHYQFITQEKAQINRVKMASSSQSAGSLPPHLISFLLLLLPMTFSFF